MKNKKGFEFSFAWIFAIVVGAVILFLAIYASTQYIKTERVSQDTQRGKELGIILTPIETNLETGKITTISTNLETRIYNECKISGTFGVQQISTAAKSSIGNNWEKPGFPSSFKNKYIFSDNIIEGKNFIVFSKPLEMPFKIADLVYIWPKENSYCFINPPREIEEELEELRIEKINITSSVSKCSKESKKVCFTTSGCDVDISLDASGKIKGSLKKKLSNRVYFETPSLLYAAIFSSPEIYECQLKRLMKRTSELSWLYFSKTSFLSSKGCSSNLESDLASYANKTFSFTNSLELRGISIDSEILKERNNDLSCKLF